ncbi:hypothetical protein ABI_15960 [Asticcacaulis biprosthecium C19]|uniref:Uncharacterized protein n=1 Tax=Asticcacaulis biprosthecium C19 TaxID=715226 RepID=F4QJH3_9CAUL|nr:hypothetical protein ABI_15960 [Asticcacaulis biprosthecium C19]
MSPFEVSAATLGEAIRQFEAAFSVTVSPYDGTDPALPFTEGEPRRYFFYSNADADRFLIDIHIFRGTEEICPKQNLDYPLQNGDIVDMAGPLVC